MRNALLSTLSQNRKSISLAVLLAVLPACHPKPSEPAVVAAATATAPSAGEVHLAIWANYVTPEKVTEFEKATGLKVQVSHYSTNEELLAKLQAGATGIDVVVPTDYMVGPLVHLGLLQKLNPAQIPNSTHLTPALKGQAYDPQNEFTLPYSFGTSGLAVDRRKFKGKIKRWKDLFETPELAGKFSLFDDGREVVGMALKMKGESLNTTDPAKLQAAKKFILSQKKRVKLFNSEAKQILIDGEVVAAQAYSSDALQASEATQGAIEYVVPEEGATLWIDNLAIPKGAQNVAGAHQLINFLLDASTGVSLTERMRLATANADARQSLPEALRSNPFIFPDIAANKKLESMHDIGDAAGQIEKIWTEIKAE